MEMGMKLMGMGRNAKAESRSRTPLLMTGRHCKINNFTRGLICDFDLIVNCDKFISDQKCMIVIAILVLAS